MARRVPRRLARPMSAQPASALRQPETGGPQMAGSAVVLGTARVWGEGCFGEDLWGGFNGFSSACGWGMTSNMYGVAPSTGVATTSWSEPLRLQRVMKDD